MCCSTHACFDIREAQAKRGEEQDVDPDQFQDPDNEYGLFAGTTYEADDEEADKIYEMVDQNMDARRRARRYVTRHPFAYRNPNMVLLFILIGKHARTRS